ncbi:ATP-dependent RNA helicase DeaD [Picrophilus oshimae DSM 9789]|uniref:ATP-dependent RNA helicase DeaD n=1 Tax=Picrophilus torridus (strain ATCC 700027 / DSM 9790 / JCM 10055 / NBRC 100828 / KAW 2/3) TaxID=1122961 RepID=A0A8G2FWY0_PICTO|nr:ATP-dependent RNA helicase DeaD [Picrophilus oshimae DSM 9789]
MFILNSFSFKIDKRIKESLDRMGFYEPTEVQGLAIPEILSGRDVVIKSMTGSGKTAAFLIPAIQRALGSKFFNTVLIVLPTRELALQTYSVALNISRNFFRTTVVYGGSSMEKQIHDLRDSKIIIGTPGRIIDLINRDLLNLEHVCMFILDEADMMLDMGFIDDIYKIIENLPEKRQNVLASATMPERLDDMIKNLMNDPELIAVSNGYTPKTIVHDYTIIPEHKKFSALLSYIDENRDMKRIIFVRTKHGAVVLSEILNKCGFKNVTLHGDMRQRSREISIKRFRNYRSGIMIATNVAARGIDIPDVDEIINFDAPIDDIKSYSHRAGRSGRFGRPGHALTIFTEKQKNMINEIEMKNNVKMDHKIIKINDVYYNIDYRDIINNIQ